MPSPSPTSKKRERGSPRAAARAARESVYREHILAAAERELERMEAADQIGAARVKLRDLWPDLTLEELRYLLGEIGLVVVVDRAPRGTELRDRVHTIVGGRFAATAED